MFPLHGVDLVPHPTKNQRTLPHPPSNPRPPPPHTNPNTSKNDRLPPQPQSCRARSCSSSLFRLLFASFVACLLPRRFSGFFSLLPFPYLFPPSLSAADDGSAWSPINLSLRPYLPDHTLAPPSHPLTSNMEGLLGTNLRPATSPPKNEGTRRPAIAATNNANSSGEEGSSSTPSSF